MCGKTMLLTRDDLRSGRESDRRVHEFWLLFASIVVWIQWLICIAAIVAAVVVRRA
jgi:hypothetical protein